MDVEVRCFWTPKKGNSSEDFEDAHHVRYASGDTSGDAAARNDLAAATSRVTPVRLAIADGASESSFAQKWARLLTRGFCRATARGRPDASTYDVARRGMGEETITEFERARSVWLRQYEKLPLPWYAEVKRDMGAFAAFVGLEIHADTPGGGAGWWEALAFGDSCLFHVRDDHVVHAFPISDPSLFGRSPCLLTTRCDIASQVDQAERLAGEWREGDEFYLLTDAAAHWLLAGLTLRDADPVAFLREIVSQEVFEQWVDQQRKDLVDGQPRLRNDDVMFVYCRMASRQRPVQRGQNEMAG
jgi:hypothetical protein